MTLPDGSRGKLEIFRDITEREHAKDELEKHHEHLEELVEKRTAELEGKTVELEGKAAELVEKNAELERMNDVFVGREFRIKELRDRIKELELTIED